MGRVFESPYQHHFPTEIRSYPLTLQQPDSGVEGLLTAPWPELVVDGPSDVRKVNTLALGNFRSIATTALYALGSDCLHWLEFRF